MPDASHSTTEQADRESPLNVGVSRRHFIRDAAALAVTGQVLAACASRGSTMAAGTTTANTSGSTAARVASGLARRPSVEGIGVQLYTVGDQMRADFEGTLAKVAEIGYRQVEFAGYSNKSARDVRAILDRLHLKAPSTHIGMELLRTDLDAQMEYANIVGHEYIVIPSLGRSETPMNTVDAWKRVAAECNTMGARLKSKGLKLAFHSHTGEFVSVGGGKTGMDVFLSETDPSLFNFQLDLGWARVAGQDPVAWFKRYPNRFVMWHVKDFENLQAAQSREAVTLREAATTTPRAAGAAPPQRAPGAGGAPRPPQPGRPSPVGSGDIDFKPILAEWKTSGMQYFFVEQDGAAQWTGGSLASIATSYRNLRALVA